MLILVVSTDMSTQYTANQMVLLVCDDIDDDDFSSDDDEAVGDFTTKDGQSFVLSSESLVQVSRTAFVLASLCERDSLLLCESSDFDVANDDCLDDTSDDTLAGNEGESVGNAAMIDNDYNSEAEESGSEVDDGNESEFKFNWCEVEPNFVEPDLPDFCEPVGISSEATAAKSPIECFKLFLQELSYPFWWHKQIYMPISCVLLKHPHLLIAGEMLLKVKCWLIWVYILPWAL